MEKPKSFKLPESFLSQLNEFTLGYMLVTVNEAGEFETFVKADNPLTRVALVKFTELVSDSLSQSLENAVANPVPEAPAKAAEDEEDGDDPFGSINV